MSSTVCSICGFETDAYLILNDGGIVCDDCVGDGNGPIRLRSPREKRRLRKTEDEE